VLRRIGLVVLICIGGCADALLVPQEAYEVKVKADLRKFQSYSAFYYMETGRYGSFEQVLEAVGSEADSDLYWAWDGHADAEPDGGYFFCEIAGGPGGGPLDRRVRTGLCAYPAKPGVTGDYIYCVLADTSALDAMGSPEEFGFVSRGEEWKMVRARYKDIGGPPRYWPSEAQLKEKFEVLEGISPEEGLRRARAAAEEYEKRK